MDDKMKSKIKETFESEVPDVLQSIKADPRFRVPEKQSGFSLRNLLNRRLMVPFMSTFVLLIVAVLVINRQSSLVVASTVTLDINPSIVIELNDDDNVVRVTALNDDGDEVVQRNIRYRGLTLDECMEILVERLNALGYVVTTDENNILVIEVESDNDEIRERVETRAKERLKNELDKFSDKNWVFDAKDFNLTPEQREQLDQDELRANVSKAKLALIYRIYTLDSESYTLRELANMPLRELYDVYLDVEDPANLPDRDKMPPPKPAPPRPHGNSDFIVTPA